MAKYFFKIQAVILVAIALTGCNDFLDKDILGYSTDEDYYDTQYKLQAALNATYDILQSDDFTSSEWRFGEALGDDIIGSNEGLSSAMGQLVQFRFNTSNTYILQRWEVNYKGIHRANQVIANAHKVRITDNDYSTYREIREILAQAKFLRALFYFNLVKTFGGVPIRPEVETVDSLVQPRATLEETYAYIEKDLREAACMLRNRFTSTNAGKASAGAAVALLMKVLMYQAEPGVYSEKWEQMKELGDYFVTGSSMTMSKMLRYDELYNGEDWETLRQRLWFKPQSLNDATDPYEGPDSEIAILYNNYTLNYNDAYGSALNEFGSNNSYVSQFFLSGEFCSGSIFEIVFKESGDGTSGDTNEGNSIYNTLFAAGSPLYADEQIITDIFGTDYRRNFTIGHHQTTPDNENTEIGAGRILSLKWYTPIKDRSIYDDDNGKNRRYLRYVDVVLMYAEALNECGEGALALEQLNSAKTVVNSLNNSSTLYVGGGYGFLRDQIWDERRMELAFEWDRFFDIVRQGRAKTVLHNYGSARTSKRGLYFREGVNEIFPIPQTEVDISNGVVTQNPGY